MSRSDLHEPFYWLPLEMRIKLFSFLEQEDLKNLRLVDKTTDHAIRNGWLYNFPEWTLSDVSAEFILNSKCRVHSILVRDLLTHRELSAENGTVLQHAREVILAGRILSENLENILQQIEKVSILWMEHPEENVLQGFISSNTTFQHLTTLELFLGNQKFERDFMWALANPNLKFPNLKGLNFSWRSKKVGRRNCWCTFWRIYIALHKMVWIHRATLSSLKWNLDLKDSLRGKCDGNLIDPITIVEVTEYKALRLKLTEVTRLKHIHICQINWESGRSWNWNLNSHLLEAQTELEHLCFKAGAFNDSEVRTIETVGIKNSSSLIKIELGLIEAECKYKSGRSSLCYHIPNLRNCHALTDLRIASFPYNPTILGNLPVGLIHLSIANGAVGCRVKPAENQGLKMMSEHYEPIVLWITDNLHGLRSLDIASNSSIRLEFNNGRRTIKHFKTFANGLPHLERISVEYFSKHKDPWYSTPFVNACLRDKTGVSVVKIQKHKTPTKSTTFHCKIDRTTFTPYPIA